METRIQRHKNYRAELIKEGSSAPIKDKPKTTTALPLKDVMDEINQDNIGKSFYAKQKRIKVIEFFLLVLLVVAIVVGLIMFGVYAFGGI